MAPNRSLVNSKGFPFLGKAKTIVLKIGTSILIDSKENLIKTKWLESLIKEVVELKSHGKNIIIVSSGSIALGKKILNLGSKKLKLDESQASGAVGQIKLAQAYEMSLNLFQAHSAQILLTSEDSLYLKKP